MYYVPSQSLSVVLILQLIISSSQAEAPSSSYILNPNMKRLPDSRSLFLMSFVTTFSVIYVSASILMR